MLGLCRWLFYPDLLLYDSRSFIWCSAVNHYGRPGVFRIVQCSRVICRIWIKRTAGLDWIKGTVGSHEGKDGLDWIKGPAGLDLNSWIGSEQLDWIRSRERSVGLDIEFG